MSGLYFKINVVKTDQNQVTEFLHLHARLERQLELASLNHDIREIEQMDLKRIYIQRVSEPLPRRPLVNTYPTFPCA